MTSEELLLQLINGVIKKLELMNDIFIDVDTQDTERLATFNDGKICGLNTAINGLCAALSIYYRFKEGNLPDNMMEGIEKKGILPRE